MQRRFIRALAISIFPLLGLAAAFAMSGCAAVPAISLANSLIHPPQQTLPAQPAAPAQPGQTAAIATPAGSPDIVGALAARFGITLPIAGAPVVQTATTPSFTTTPAPTTTAAR